MRHLVRLITAVDRRALLEYIRIAVFIQLIDRLFILWHRSTNIYVEWTIFLSITSIGTHLLPGSRVGPEDSMVNLPTFR
jgi:hypothetical protein